MSPPTPTKLRVVDRPEPSRRLPTNLALEQKFLGTILSNNTAYRQVSNIIAFKHFSHGAHQRIWGEITRLIDLGIEASPLTLASVFEVDPELQALGGGAQYLAELAACTPTEINAEAYAREIARLWRKRENIPLVEETLEALYRTDELGPSAAEIMRNISNNGVADDEFDLGEWDFGEDNEPIPPRGWLLGNLLCRQFYRQCSLMGVSAKPL
jgi:hypothetical protein